MLDDGLALDGDELSLEVKSTDALNAVQEAAEFVDLSDGLAELLSGAGAT